MVDAQSQKSNTDIKERQNNLKQQTKYRDVESSQKYKEMGKLKINQA